MESPCLPLDHPTTNVNNNIPAQVPGYYMIKFFADIGGPENGKMVRGIQEHPVSVCIGPHSTRMELKTFGG